MIDKVLAILAPHHCCGCQKIGTLLCNDCKYDIIYEPYSRCLSCSKPSNKSGICSECRVAYSQGWCIGERTGVLEQLVNDYKFMRVKAASGTLSELMLEILPDMPTNTVIVPVPTISKHIRQRGYDHTYLIAKEVARRRSISFAQPLVRLTTAAQRGATRSERINQAKLAFGVDGIIQPDATYLLIDDVMTTGATLNYAAKALKAAGASEVWVAIIARSPLD